MRKLTRKLMEQVLPRLSAGLSMVGAEFVAQYQERISIRVEPPPNARGEPYPMRSVAGEYPRQDTGQGLESVAFELLRGGQGVLVGVRGDYPGPLGGGIDPTFSTHDKPGGEHLIELSTEGNNWNRLGPVEAWEEIQGELIAAFERGVELESGGAPGELDE